MSICREWVLYWNKTFEVEVSQQLVARYIWFYHVWFRDQWIKYLFFYKRNSICIWVDRGQPNQILASNWDLSFYKKKQKNRLQNNKTQKVPKNRALATNKRVCLQQRAKRQQRNFPTEICQIRKHWNEGGPDFYSSKVAFLKLPTDSLAFFSPGI